MIYNAGSWMKQFCDDYGIREAELFYVTGDDERMLDIYEMPKRFGLKRFVKTKTIPSDDNESSRSHVAVEVVTANQLRDDGLFLGDK